MSYARHAHLTAAATNRPAIWRLIAGCITAFALVAAWMVGLVFTVSLIWGVAFPEAVVRAFGAPPDEPALAFIYLLVVAGLGFGTIVAARLWQKRSPGSLFGTGATTLRHFTVGLFATFAVVALVSILPPWNTNALTPNLDLATWVKWLPFALLAIAAQTGSEELFFRGYLQSQLAARFRSPLIWLFIPALIFGFAHFVPVIPAQNAALYVGFALVFGLLAGDLTARTGSIGAGWGFHFGNNAMALLAVASPGTVTGLSLYVSDVDFAEPIILTPRLFLDLFAVVLVWLFIRRILRV